MLISEIVLLVLVGLLLLRWLLRLWQAAGQQERLFLIEPGWSGDGRKYIVRATTEHEADQIYLRHVCGWDTITPTDRSNAVITVVELDEQGVAVIHN